MSAVITHGIFAGDAVREVAGAGFQNLWLTDTLPMNEDIKGLRGVQCVSVAPLLVTAIRRITNGDSLEEIYG